MKNKKLKSDFVKILNEYKKLLAKENELSKHGISYDFFNDHHELLKNVLGVALDKQEMDWFDWWAFEAEFGDNKSIANSVSINNRSFTLETPEEFVDFLFDKRK